MPGRQYPPEIWTTIKALIVQGVTLREISKTQQIPYSTLISRSARDGWNVKALQCDLKLPRRTKAQRKALDDAMAAVPDNLPAIANEIKANFSAVLLKMSRFYSQAENEITRKDSRAVLQFIYAANKLLGFDNGKSANLQPALNVQLLALKPADLGAIVNSQTQQIRQITDSQSVGEGTAPEGNPNQLTLDPPNPSAE